jgi:hypothetical protein
VSIDKRKPGAKPQDHPTQGDAGRTSSREAPVGNNVTGRVKFDDRGNAVWEWAVSTGKFGVEISSTRLKRLDDPTLSLTEEPTSAGKPTSAAHGYSPYDSGGPLAKAADPPKPKKTDLRRLSEWMKLRQQYERNKK